ncbi:hypothetical protein A0256_23440 [Mucilaginibacter sp. PAMC 26640]|nr:hypothetical protein A0256_23440 [Mucilaginibacter sp. PAMC 26640]
MPTDKQIAAQIAKASVPIKQNLVHHITDTAMHLLHDSYLTHTNLWPKNGIHAGWGIGCSKKDRIYIGVNAYGWNQNPIIGRLGINIGNTGVRRKAAQVKHLEILLDYAYINDVFFEDEFRNVNWFDHPIWFKFTYNTEK